MVCAQAFSYSRVFSRRGFAFAKQQVLRTKVGFVDEGKGTGEEGFEASGNCSTVDGMGWMGCGLRDGEEDW